MKHRKTKLTTLQKILMGKGPLDSIPKYVPRKPRRFDRRKDED